MQIGLEENDGIIFQSKEKKETRQPEIVKSRHIGRTNLTIVLNGDNEEECEQIKKELMKTLHRLKRKHKLGYALIKLHNRKSSLANLLQYLFDFD